MPSKSNSTFVEHYLQEIFHPHAYAILNLLRKAKSPTHYRNIAKKIGLDRHTTLFHLATLDCAGLTKSDLQIVKKPTRTRRGLVARFYATGPTFISIIGSLERKLKPKQTSVSSALLKKFLLSLKEKQSSLLHKRKPKSHFRRGGASQ